MSKKSFTVLADDLTGAFEIAAIGHGPGLRSVVSMRLQPLEEEADLVVYDSETRLCGAEAAAIRIRDLAMRLREQPHTRFLFKKTDSVMRGPIAVELCTLMQALGMKRTILVPANPHLGRTIKDGIYRVDGIPLDKTAFAGDLHHPARSADVRQLLGEVPGLPVHLGKPGKDLPRTGIIIGDARSGEDLSMWADLWDNETLLAGGGGLFQALIKKLNRWPGSAEKPLLRKGRHLLVSGTTHSAQQVFLSDWQALGIPVVEGSTGNTEVDAGMEWGKKVISHMAQASGCLLHMRPDPEPDPANAGWVRQQMAMATAIALETGHIEHLIVEGGATAAAIANYLSWDEFEVRHVWSPGVVTTSPLRQKDLYFTIKPGSYPWPENLKKELWPSLPGSLNQSEK